MKRTYKRLLVFFVMILLIALPKNTVVLNAKAKTVSINAKNFPDANFRIFIKARYDKNKDGKLSPKEIEAVKVIRIEPDKIEDLILCRATQEIRSLNGLRHFTNLRKLKFCNYNVKTLYLASPKLEDVSITGASIKHFRLSGGDNLRNVYLSVDTGTDKLNLQKFKNIEHFAFWSSKPIRYDNLGITKCKKLKSLDIRNEIRANHIDLTKFPNLEFVSLLGEVKSVNATNMKKLDTLCLQNLGLKKLNVQGSTNLTWLNCYENKLEQLDLTNLKKLDKLFCDKKTKIIGRK